MGRCLFAQQRSLPASYGPAEAELMCAALGGWSVPILIEVRPQLQKAQGKIDINSLISVACCRIRCADKAIRRLSPSDNRARSRGSMVTESGGRRVELASARRESARRTFRSRASMGGELAMLRCVLSGSHR